MFIVIKDGERILKRDIGLEIVEFLPSGCLSLLDSSLDLGCSIELTLEETKRLVERIRVQVMGLGLQKIQETLDEVKTIILRRESYS